MPAKLNHALDELPIADFKDIGDFLRWFRPAYTKVLNHSRTVQQSMLPPTQVATVIVTPIAGGNVVDFERTDGETYFIYHGTSGDFSKAAAVEVKLASRWTDNVGDSGVTKFYWVVARKGFNNDAPPSPPKSGTTLALNVTTTLPTPLPPSTAPVKSDESGNTVDAEFKIGR